MYGPPTQQEEQLALQKGYKLIAGIDEVGRGPLAGPVVAAAVILSPRADVPWLGDLRDSKQLTAKKREVLHKQILAEAPAVGVGISSSLSIDTYGIVKATKMAMVQAVENLPFPPGFLLIDAVHLDEAGIPYKAIIHGDALCCSIAAASIVAKVTRDWLMAKLDETYPGYGFAKHKGYGTREHLDCLERLGPSPIHRRCFAPLRQPSLDLRP